MKRMGLAAMALLAACAGATAGEATIVGAEAAREADGTWTISVTVAHGDEGWDHYADRWEILAPDGRVVASRVLTHPHETEQPFTRSLSGIVLPDDLAQVTVRAHDTVHGDGPADYVLDLAR